MCYCINEMDTLAYIARNPETKFWMGPVTSFWSRILSLLQIFQRRFCFTNVTPKSKNRRKVYTLLSTIFHIIDVKGKPMNSVKKGTSNFYSPYRDEGITIRISILQWFVETCNLILYLVYFMFFVGLSPIADKFFNVYLVAFVMIIQPSFYISGDYRFRVNVANHGLFRALQIAFSVWAWAKYSTKFWCYTHDTPRTLLH